MTSVDCLAELWLAFLKTGLSLALLDVTLRLLKMVKDGLSCRASAEDRDLRRKVGDEFVCVWNWRWFLFLFGHVRSQGLCDSIHRNGMNLSFKWWFWLFDYPLLIKWFDFNLMELRGLIAFREKIIFVLKLSIGLVRPNETVVDWRRITFRFIRHRRTKIICIINFKSIQLLNTTISIYTLFEYNYDKEYQNVVPSFRSYQKYLLLLCSPGKGWHLRALKLYIYNYKII